MTKETHAETMQFQTEVNQLLNLMIHSLYSNREIFLRELISNASDALDKRRFEGLTDSKLIDGQGTPQIDLAFDKEAKTLTITDNGIGMTREEVIENIGTIAKSGTKAFWERLEADQKNASQLIGQFGVGFYSAFIVAHEIELITRKAGTDESEATHWQSKGEGEFTLTQTTRDRAGTTVILHMREDDLDLLNEWSIRDIVKKYSDHIAYPIMMGVEKPIPPKEGEEADDLKHEIVIEQINSAESLWQRERSEISDEEYIAFYKELTHDYTDPLSWSHNRVEGNTTYTSLLYVPAVAPRGLWDQEVKYGIDLYVQRVFIMEGSDKLIPRYLRFIQGVVDTQDLPLNISREILQNSRTIDTIRQGLTRRSLSMLETLSQDEEKYQKFWGAFGRVLKEGLGEDFSNREKIANLLRFASTTTDEETVSLKAYKERMQEGQDKIYYITADSLNTAKNSPHLEIFKSKGIEVILMTDVIDDWMTGFLHEFDGTPMVNVAKGDIELDKEQEAEEKPAANEEEVKLIDRVQKVLGDRVESVKISKRLTDSASVLVRNEHALSGHFEKMLKEAGHDVPSVKPWLEINPKHPLLVKLSKTDDAKVEEDIAMLVYEEAQLLEGAQLDNPSEFVARLNRLMNA
ncbi:molecular chaperone HtpG [Ignatzschineria cameli]|uniref:Chaperone protein HtpG n=1 Tax=Ignatzschineria cameli TaxID=2182793 RepID=A0ABX5L324_9GAMM|nr:molecular chaperone HtpG [Ignatzschineria cameli]PWD91144.1 molecular chaperone HtpG [Ignatzschineria cameli]PWD92785.1 molecular chaperone HtpG [Ignatzschineria cameli]PWD93806.1 molecular chaperone HtpG [Ignatzschineria cameli]